MIINNIELIKPLLEFKEQGDFFFLLILRRKKDFPELEQKNHQSVRTIKTYCIDSIEYLNKRWEEIVTLSELFKARVYINIQKQNHNDVSLNMLSELALRIQHGTTNQKNLFDSVVGQLKTKEKRWVVDIDTKNENSIIKIITAIEDCKPYSPDKSSIKPYKIIEQIPTKNGWHLITIPFDVQEFNKHLSELDDVPEIQKKNPTLLYYPNSLES